MTPCLFSATHWYMPSSDRFTASMESAPSASCILSCTNTTQRDASEHYVHTQVHTHTQIAECQQPQSITWRGLQKGGEERGKDKRLCRPLQAWPAISMADYSYWLSVIASIHFAINTIPTLKAIRSPEFWSKAWMIMVTHSILKGFCVFVCVCICGHDWLIGVPLELSSLHSSASCRTAWASRWPCTPRPAVPRWPEPCPALSGPTGASLANQKSSFQSRRLLDRNKCRRVCRPDFRGDTVHLKRVNADRKAGRKRQVGKAFWNWCRSQKTGFWAATLSLETTVDLYILLKLAKVSAAALQIWETQTWTGSLSLTKSACAYWGFSCPCVSGNKYKAASNNNHNWNPFTNTPTINKCSFCATVWQSTAFFCSAISG